MVMLLMMRKLYLNSEINLMCILQAKPKSAPQQRPRLVKQGRVRPLATSRLASPRTKTPTCHHNQGYQRGISRYSGSRATPGSQTSCQPQPEKLKEIKLLFFRGELWVTNFLEGVLRTGVTRVLGLTELPELWKPPVLYATTRAIKATRAIRATRATKATRAT